VWGLGLIVVVFGNKYRIIAEPIAKSVGLKRTVEKSAKCTVERACLAKYCYNINPRVRIKEELVLFNTRELGGVSSISESTLYTSSV